MLLLKNDLSTGMIWHELDTAISLTSHLNIDMRIQEVGSALLKRVSRQIEYSSVVSVSAFEDCSTMCRAQNQISE